MVGTVLYNCDVSELGKLKWDRLVKFILQETTGRSEDWMGIDPDTDRTLWKSIVNRE